MVHLKKLKRFRIDSTRLSFKKNGSFCCSFHEIKQILLKWLTHALLSFKTKSGQPYLCQPDKRFKLQQNVVPLWITRYHQSKEPANLENFSFFKKKYCSFVLFSILTFVTNVAMAQNILPKKMNNNVRNKQTKTNK